MDPHCFEEAQTNLELDLHPSCLRDVRSSIHDQLDNMLLMYRPELQGVVLSYSEMTIHSNSAAVHTFFPYFHIKASAKLQLLKLHAGQFLGVSQCVAVGNVSKVGHDYVALLVLGAFNVAIRKQDMQDRFKHDKQVGGWVHVQDSSHQLVEKTQVRFQVQRVDAHQSHFIILGSLAPEVSGALEKITIEQSQDATVLEHASPQIIAKKARKEKNKHKRKSRDGLVHSVEDTVPMSAGGPHAYCGSYAGQVTDHDSVLCNPHTLATASEPVESEGDARAGAGARAASHNTTIGAERVGGCIAGLRVSEEGTARENGEKFGAADGLTTGPRLLQNERAAATGVAPGVEKRSSKGKRRRKSKQGANV